MSGLQLHINTALDKAYIAVSQDGQILGYMENLQQKEHASFLQPAIRDVLFSLHKKVRDLSSISVIHGPGSYTGLRVGLSAAKGICYACQIPLICISTLEWLAIPCNLCCYPAPWYWMMIVLKTSYLKRRLCLLEMVLSKFHNTLEINTFVNAHRPVPGRKSRQKWQKRCLNKDCSQISSMLSPII